ncbi:MAG TPA: zinc-ribbon domain-containing protein [Candidatus Dojkabacteria bacterium]|jgi:DNA-directed RNA polymerase subunit RPC12/RpoP|nr:zinc-ribbon domain-containing protein [Candidatus Dojkabacteria bacterium]
MNLEDIILDFFDFVGNIDFNMFGTLFIVALVVFWLVIIGWVWVDSSERTSKKGLKIGYILLVIFFNIFGLIIYLIIRPSETIEEIYWEDLERRYLKYETSELGDCPRCGSQLYPGYVFCTNCGYRLKVKCPQCGVLIDKDHVFCEYCGFKIKERATVQEEHPTVKVMEEQITATKREAEKTVESRMTKYKTGNSFVVKLGNSIVSSVSKLGGKKKEKDEEQVVQESKNQQKNVQSSKQKKKKKKKKR